MSDLTDAATNLSNAATRANKTTDFFDDVTTLGPTSTVKNPNNNKTVPSVQKQVKDLFDALPPTEEFTELESAALAAGTTYDNITYSNNLVDEIKGYLFDATGQITYAVPESAQGKFISSVVGGVLTTTDTSEYALYKINQDVPKEYFNIAIHIKDLGVLNGSIVDARDLVFGQSFKVYVPEGFTFRCNLLPDDDVRVFVGGGSLLSVDPWGNPHNFYIGLMSDRYNQKQSVRQRAYNKLLQNKSPRFGVVGDSITDGDNATGWYANPTDGSGNLSSTNYNHDSGGGARGYFAVFRNTTQNVVGKDPVGNLETFNASSSGKKLIDGWAYRNFDYGFFQNTAYKNAAPDICFLAMGHNDSITSDELVNDYLDAFDAFISKCTGYGSTIGLITTSIADTRNNGNESFKDTVSKLYGIDWYNLGGDLIDYAFNGNTPINEIYYDGASVNDFDFTHPHQIGHTFMGLKLLSYVFDTRVTEFTNNEIVSAIRTAKHISYDASTKIVYNTNTLYLTDEPYQEDFGMLSRCVAPNNPVFDFLIDNKISGGVLNITIPLPSVQGAPAYMNLINSNKNQYTKSIVGDGSTDQGYYTMQVPELDYGPNIVRIYYDGSGVAGSSTGYAPILSVTNPDGNDSAAQYFADIANDGIQPITVVDTSRPYHKDKYTGGIGSRLADRVTEVYKGRISVKAKYVQGMRFWIAKKPDVSFLNGHYVEFTNATTLTVKDAGGTVLASRAGLTITDEVKFQIRYEGNTVYLLSESSQSAGFPRKGGMMYLENKSGSASGDYWLNVNTNFATKL